MERFQIKRITRTKNGLFLAGLIAVGILLGCVAQKQVIQERAGIIKVMISGVEQQELKFCEVKAIASGKEYLAANKFEMLLELTTDASTGRVIKEGPIVGLFTIEGVPAGPAEVRVRFKQENLPAQGVEVKRGTSVTANFKFTVGKVTLSGKVTQLGNPASKWLVTFRPTDGKPAPATAGVQTASDGSYNHKLNPGTYEIQLSEPTVVDIEKRKVAGWLPMFTTTYTVTKTETLDLEVSTLKKIESKKSAQLTQAQGPFVINDKRLLQLSDRDPCHTDAEITASNRQGYQTRGIVEVFGGQYHLWCNGAKHTWIGRHENIQGAIAVIDSDKENPLQFRIDKEKGYVYQKGKGTVTMPDGKVVKLPVIVGVGLKDSITPSRSTTLDLTGEWEGTANWQGIIFTVTFSVTENKREITNLKVIYECAKGVGKIAATLTKPVTILEDNTFNFVTGQGSSGTATFVSGEYAEGSYKAPFSMKCGDDFLKISGKWTAQKKKK